MHMVPRSIAGRITLVLIGGLLLSLLAAIGVASLGGVLEDDESRYPHLLGRIATVAAIASSAPAERRPALLEDLISPPLTAGWSATPDARTVSSIVSS